MPTKEMLEQRRAELSGAKQALLEKRRQRITPVATKVNTIPRRPQHEPAPASFTQQRLWFLQQMEPDNTAYNETRAVHIRQTLDTDALKRALLEIMRRHEILRTNFVLSNGQVQQVIHAYEDAAPRFSLHEFDLQTVPAEEQKAAASHCIATVVRKPFRLAHDMLWQSALIKLGPQDTILVTVLHHILCDGWGLDIFDTEIGTLYEAYCTGKSSPLADLAIQYADYAYWQQHTLTGEYLEQQLAYWQRVLADPPKQQPFIRDSLPQSHEDEEAKGARLSFSVPATTTQQLKALSMQEGVTLFMTLLATFQILLYHYSGQTDILIGSPIANRTRPEFEPLIGCFINTLVLRTSLAGNPTVQELLQRVRETALGAYAHQDVPFEKLVETLSPERDLHRNPFFQVLFTFQSYQQQSQRSPSSDIAAWQVDAVAAKFDLDLMMWESEGELRGDFSYDSSFFAPSTVARIQQHFVMLLSTIATASTHRLLDIPTQTEAEQRAIEQWNSTQTSYPEHSCIHHIFETQAVQTPDAIAIIAGKQRITYRDLDRKANQLAHHLQKLQVGPGSLVGLYLERSPDMIVSLLAILKAGGAYVPLDIAAPAERVAFMLQDANIAVLVTEQQLQQQLFQGKVAHILYLDSVQAQIERESTQAPAAQVTAHDLAYVIYTSGSTGSPKGVLVPHQAVVNYNWTFMQRYQMTSRDRFLQFASICFDTAEEEIYATLFSGAALVMRPDAYAPSIQELYQLINETRLSILDLPVAYWHEWTATLSSQTLDFPRSVRLLIVGGEKVLAEYMAVWQQYAAQHVAVISNSYGPTETTVAATAYDITAPTTIVETDIPIGHPQANAQTYILNPATLQPVPIGAPGELCIAGTGLAWGYLHESAKTADRFIPNPFSHTPGARLYKTGDLVRYRDDGNIEFRGRVDHQVKIRGYRIELGEIEHVLRRHPAVRESVVLALEDQSGEKQLVAFVAPHENQQVEVKALRELLKASLPPYMEPSAFFILADLPLNTNGKIDRRALAALSKQGSADDQSDDEEAATPLEEILRLLWAEILEVEEIAIHTNFFDAGGHSLQATRLLARIQDTLEVEIPLHFIFDAPTIADFAQVLLQDPQRREQIEATVELLLSVAQLSEDEVETMLQEAE